ncbi:MAG: hypothetical protein LBE69_10640, partial [Klebsiella sp.]|nr:hypothetical protein [Klebsiella sp.]
MKTIRTTCPYCGVGCGVLASVDDAGRGGGGGGGPPPPPPRPPPRERGAP